MVSTGKLTQGPQTWPEQSDSWTGHAEEAKWASRYSGGPEAQEGEGAVEGQHWLGWHLL